MLSRGHAAATALLTLLSAAPAHSAALPTHGAVTHFDLGGDPPDTINLNPGASVAKKFSDDLEGSVWHWETEFQNQNNFATDAFSIRFTTAVGQSISNYPALGIGVVGPVIDFHFDESAVQETGNWRWMVTNNLLFSIGVDASITEDPETITPFDPPNAEPFGIEFVLVPEPSTALALALIVASVGHWRRQRDRRPSGVLRLTGGGRRGAN